MYGVNLDQKLNELAELRDWSIRKIASKAGVPQQTLANAKGGTALRVDAAIKVARVMDVPVEWLFDDTKNWADLDRRPFWLPPDVDPRMEIDARRGFVKALADGPPRPKKNVSERHIAKSDRPATPAPKDGDAQRRRKSGGGGA